FVERGTGDEEWDRLPDFWNHFPPPGTGQCTAHLGLPPLGAAAALLLADQLAVIKIKVPLGLPDPTPYIPPANPPTFAKWKLGKRLFFDPNWLYPPEVVDKEKKDKKDKKEKPVKRSCANCHIPSQGYTEHENPVTRGGVMNTPSLMNCVYNTHQFW